MTVPEDNPNYNKLFSIFVDPESSEGEQLQGMIAYGLYKRAKSEWAKSIWNANGHPPTPEELASYHATWTATNIRSMSDLAASSLAEFAQSVIDEATPAIQRKALEGNFWKNVGTNMFAAFLYSVVLILLVLVLRWIGVDILGLFQKLGPAN
jgi:hypothetical protein